MPDWLLCKYIHTYLRVAFLIEEDVEVKHLYQELDLHRCVHALSSDPATPLETLSNSLAIMALQG